MANQATSILNLGQLVAKLPTNERNLFERIYQLSVMDSQLIVPDSMLAFVERNFGSIETIENQTIVKLTNRFTLETSLFNPLRSLRPKTFKDKGDLQQIIAQGAGTADPFNAPLEDTPEDIFGRIEGDFCVTASNIAKVDELHGVTIFNQYDPLTFNRDQVIDYLLTARTWGEAAHNSDPQANYFFLLWNCLWKAGASVIHGHLQMMLTHDMHYGKIERLRRDALTYRERFNRVYFTDLVNLHRSLGLTADPADRVKAIVSLTPLKEKEIWLITDDFSPELGEAVYNTLAFYRSVGVTAFNLGVLMPPIAPPNNPKEDWSGFPVIVRLVDRGDPLSRGSDIGAIEMFAANSIVGDPFHVADNFKTFLQKNR